MMIEKVLSMLTTASHLKHQHHWRADCLRTRMVFIIAALNLLQGHGVQPDAAGMVHLSIAAFSL